VAIVNVLGSTLYRQADYRVLIGAGVEKAVVGTKSLIAMVAIQLYAAYALIGKEDEAQALLLKSAKDIKYILSREYIDEMKKTVDDIKVKEHVFIIGRGLSYATTLEATLKLKEACLVHAEGFAGGELKHGSLALIEKGTPCIVFAPNDETFDAIISNAQELKARGGFIIGIGPKENNVFDRFLKTADNKEATMLSQIAVSHVFAYYLALARGVEDPDKPRNLAKSVTVK
jgi:glutamine---fructose-6-phosphate transaminase (isomerizing)